MLYIFLFYSTINLRLSLYKRRANPVFGSAQSAKYVNHVIYQTVLSAIHVSLSPYGHRDVSKHLILSYHYVAQRPNVPLVLPTFTLDDRTSGRRGFGLSMLHQILHTRNYLICTNRWPLSNIGYPVVIIA